jgi:hypothetical protein
MENEDELNEKIAKITTVINDKYPELLKFLNEMKVDIPDKNHKKTSLENLIKYHNSINSLLNKYIENQKLTNL